MNSLDEKEFKKFMKKWAHKKMQKLEKKLHYYARIFFGEPVMIVYVKKDAKIVYHNNDGSESRLGGRE